MEEAEALSTKMGIMVKGGIFKCFGSSQHIKNKYGTGYEIEVKVKKMTQEEELKMNSIFELSSTKSSVTLAQCAEIMRRKNVENFLISEI